MKLLRDVLSMLFPPSLKHLGTVPAIIASDAFRRELAKPEAEKFDGAGEVIAYTLYVPSHVVRDRMAA